MKITGLLIELAGLAMQVENVDEDGRKDLAKKLYKTIDEMSVGIKAQELSEYKKQYGNSRLE